jgi:hypothetical protein
MCSRSNLEATVSIVHRSPVSPKPLTGSPLTAVSDAARETLADVSANLGPYAMIGLVFLLAGMVVTVIPTLVTMGVTAVGAALALAASGVAIVGAAQALDSGAETLGAAVVVLTFASYAFMFVVVVVFSVLMVLGTTALSPLVAATMRAMAAHQRGERALSARAVLADVRLDAPVILTVFVLQSVSMAAALLGGVGVIVPAVLFAFAVPLVVLHGDRPMAAFRRSAAHARAHLGWHVGYALCVMGVSLVANYVPVVGPMFALSLYVRMARHVFGDAPPVALRRAA